MFVEKFTYLGCDGRTNIAGYYYKTNKTPEKGLVYFAHGVTEYAQRHESLFEALNDAGYSVLANDHMGHGDSIHEYKTFFNSRGGVSGWDCACRDAYMCVYYGKKVFDISKSLPVYGIGFSLGSFVVRTLAIRTPDLFTGLVLVGTGYQSLIKTSLGTLVATLEGEKYGYKNETDMISKLTFDEYNKHFSGKTRVDWLCLNLEERDKYLNDERCGKAFTAGLFKDLLFGIEYTCNRQNMKQMNTGLPILLLSGSRDAVGDFGKGVKTLHQKLSKLGYSSEYIIYNMMRHDILHETGVEKVHNDIITFLDKISIT